MKMNTTEIVKSLRELNDAVVTTTKNQIGGKMPKSDAEGKAIRKVLGIMLQRKPTEEEVNEARGG